MEREFLQYLEFNIFVHARDWSAFTEILGLRIKSIVAHQKHYIPVHESEYVEYGMGDRMMERVSSSSTLTEEEEGGNAYSTSYKEGHQYMQHTQNSYYNRR
jgi:hypothetical protein